MKIEFWTRFDFRSLGLGLVFRVGSMTSVEACAVIGPLALHVAIHRDY